MHDLLIVAVVSPSKYTIGAKGTTTMFIRLFGKLLQAKMKYFQVSKCQPISVKIRLCCLLRMGWLNIGLTQPTCYKEYEIGAITNTGGNDRLARNCSKILLKTKLNDLTLLHVCM
jgi:hypothetical protein